MAGNKALDFNQTVYALASEHPEIIPIMKELGFGDIVKPGMLDTAGRFMTIPKGAKMKGIDLGLIKKAFRERGYEPTGE